MAQQERITVVVDRERFLNTRNALTNAFVGLSGAIDEAVKAYVNHTNAVLDGVGGNTLDVSGLLQPFNVLGNAGQFAQLAQQAILQNGNGLPGNLSFNPDGTKKKRSYKPRDPNAPKRPLTAYFRYLQEQRPLISEELKHNPIGETGKAGDISKIATERWNTLDDQYRKPYRDAYEAELVDYHNKVRAYKASGGQLDDLDATGVEDDEALPPLNATAPVAAGGNDDDDEDDSDDDSEDSSDEDDSEEEDEVPARPPQPAPQPVMKVEKNTSKVAPKKTKAGADPQPQTYSSFGAPPAPVLPSPELSSNKRKANGDTNDGEKKKKRSRKSKAEQEAEDSAAAAAQLLIDPQLTHQSFPQPGVVAEKTKKEKKKKRKGESTTAN